MNLPAEDIANLIVGKKIAKIDYYGYMHWPMCIESIEFKDGTILNLGGNADCAHVIDLEKGGEQITPTETEPGFIDRED